MARLTCINFRVRRQRAPYHRGDNDRDCQQSLMKLALLSDIHSNIQAFDACLADARARGATQIALLGDMVGYGADPVAVMQRVMALADEGAWVLKGNHDALACHPPEQPSAHALGEVTAGWTHSQLSADQRRFLDALPLTHQHDSTLLVHASADFPERWYYVRDERSAAESLAAAAHANPLVRYVFGGHVHQQALYYRGSGRGLMRFMPTPGTAIPVPSHRSWLATIGSVGQPRDGRTEAGYALFDRGVQRLTYVRVPYDFMAAAAAIRAAGLPDFFADRLLRGE